MLGAGSRFAAGGWSDAGSRAARFPSTQAAHRGWERRGGIDMTPIRPGSGATARVSLAIGASASVVAAVLLDVLAGEHPTHTLSLALVALVVAGVRLYMGGRHESVFAIVAAALVAQPALHATSKLGEGHAVVVDDGLMHLVLADGPGTVMQVVTTAAIVVAVALSSRIAELFIGAVLRPVLLLVAAAPAPVRTVHVAIDSLREGSMLRWCGWSLRAARRGPPAPVCAPWLPPRRLERSPRSPSLGSRGGGALHPLPRRARPVALPVEGS
jgi:hypothetical protein